MKIFLCPNLEKKACMEYLHEACEILISKGCGLYADKALSGYIDDKSVVFGTPSELVPTCDCILVVGGDGTILKHAKKFALYKKAVLGLNSGRLGFMATLEHNEINLLERFCDGDYTVSNRMMLKAVAHLKSGEIKEFDALNDIVFAKGDGCKIADFEVSKNGNVVTSIRADGLIFSTPTGATAYSLSAGGPIIEPELDSIEFTQICPHSLFARSMLFTPDSELTVKYSANNNPAVRLEVDGVAKLLISPDDRVSIMRSEKVVSLIDISGSSFYDSVNRKLARPLKG